MNSVLRTVVLGGVLGAGIVSGGALAVAQTAGTTVPPAAEVPGTAPGTTEPPAAGDAAPATPGTPGTNEKREKRDHPGRAGKRGRGHGRHLLGRLGASSKELAAELGVTTEQLRDAQKAAMQAVHDLGKPERPSTRPPSDEDKAKLQEARKARAELYNKTLAEKLGVTTDRLRDARIAVVTKRLDEAVAAGKLTREQADKILARAKDAASGDLDGALGGLGKGFGFGHGRGPGARDKAPAGAPEQGS